MATLLLETQDRTFADVLHDLGDVSPERIRFPAGNATEQDVIRYLHGVDKRIYELIDGVLVEKVMGLREAILASFLGRIIGNFVAQHDLGVVFAPDGPVRIKVGRIRFPDTGFIPWERIPDGVVPTAPISDIVPTLSIEVISESNRPKEMKDKLRDYFEAGVKLVWYIYPQTESAVVYTSPTRGKKLGIADSLSGGQVLSGFSLPLKEVFGQFERKRKS